MLEKILAKRQQELVEVRQTINSYTPEQKEAIICNDRLIEVLNDWFDMTVPWPEPDPWKLQGQCVQLIRWLLANYWGLPQWPGIKGAADFWAAYDDDQSEAGVAFRKHWEKIPNTPDFVPIEGDVFIQDHSKGGGFGHIGVVMGRENTVSRFTALEQNYKPLVVTQVQRNYNSVLGFFRRKGAV